MEQKVIRVFGPSEKIDALVKQAEAQEGILVQQFTLDDLEQELRLNALLLHLQKTKQVNRAVAEFNEIISHIFQKAGIKGGVR